MGWDFLVNRSVSGKGSLEETERDKIERRRQREIKYTKKERIKTETDKVERRRQCFVWFCYL